MKDLLRASDKQLFEQVKDGKLSLDQLKCRIYEKSSKGKNSKFYCLDDLIKNGLEENIYKINEKEVDEYIKMIYHKDIKDLTAEESKRSLE